MSIGEENPRYTVEEVLRTFVCISVLFLGVYGKSPILKTRKKSKRIRIYNSKFLKRWNVKISDIIKLILEIIKSWVFSFTPSLSDMNNLNRHFGAFNKFSFRRFNLK